MTTRNHLWRRMLLTVLCFCAVLMASFLFIGKAEAATVKSGKIGNCPWSIDTNNILTIGDGKTYSGFNASFSYNPTWKIKSWPWSNDMDHVTKVVIKGKIIAGDDLTALFAGDENIREIQGLSNIDTSNTRVFSRIFSGCSSLKMLDLSSWNTSKAEDMSWIFSFCDSLQSLNISGWQSQNMAYKPFSQSEMFTDTNQLQRVNLGKNFVFYYHSSPRLVDQQWQKEGTNRIYTTAQVTSQNPQQQYPGWYVKYTKRTIPLTGITVSLSNTTLTVGQTTQLKATKNPANTTDTGKITWSSSNSKVATVDTNGKVMAKAAGTTVITATCSGKTARSTITVKAKTIPTQPTIKEPAVLYKTQIQTYGWEKNYRKNGEKSGTQGQSKRLETIRIKLDNQPYNGDIQYQTHIQRIGWQGYVKNDQESGTVGRGLRLEAIQIRLTGDMAENYDIYYRVHAQHFGWLDWAKNDQKAGTSTYGYRLEAIQIKLVKKGQPAPGKTATPYRTQGIQYTTHVQRIGWQPYVSDGAMAGTKGKSLRLEGIRIKVNNELASGNILYRTHVQTYGWEKGWRSNDQMSGTSGQAKRLEAIEIKLTGDMAKKYDVYYRVHAQHFGDLGWAKNGENAGTAGYSYRLEGIRILLVPKGGKAPGSTVNAFRNKNDEFDNQIVDIVNQYRRQYKLPSVSVNPYLKAATAIRAKELSTLFSHIRPNGSMCYTAVQGNHFYAMAENIVYASSFIATPTQFMNMWMNSTGHRANILNGNYHSIGVGHYTKNGITYAVQLFGN